MERMGFVAGVVLGVVMGGHARSGGAVLALVLVLWVHLVAAAGSLSPFFLSVFTDLSRLSTGAINGKEWPNGRCTIYGG